MISFIDFLSSPLNFIINLFVLFGLFINNFIFFMVMKLLSSSNIYGLRDL